ncbi:MAG: hypothetical protein JWP09_224 [Candidatus Taylorbacteria bacterium]|nr:hypothetical protein [Candidatus Taylorbacteria bacterium]
MCASILSTIQHKTKNMNRYILEESRMPDGTLAPVRIIYVGETLNGLTFAEIVEDRRKVFGERWANCLSSGNTEMLVFTLFRPAFKRYFKGDLK